MNISSKVCSWISNPCSLLLITSLGAMGCNKDTGASAQNNGSLAQLSSPRAQVTGVLMVFNAALASTKAEPKCFQPPEGDAARYVKDCGFIQTCTATLVRLDGVREPFVVSAAHCDPSDLLKMTVSSPSSEDVGASETSTSQSGSGVAQESESRNLTATATKGRNALFLHLPSSKTWLELEGWVGHPSYNDTFPPFKLAGSDVNADLALARIVSRDLSKVKSTATIETNVPKVIPPEAVRAQFESDIGGGPGNDALTSFRTSFDRAVFDSFPSSDLYGFGNLNNVGVDGVSQSEHTNKKECEAKEGQVWAGYVCVFKYQNLKNTSNTNRGTDLRYLNMRLAFSDVRRGYAVFLSPSSYPKGGTCQGDSGGPSFLGNDGVRLFAVESYGPFPCAGSPTVRTVVATHLDWVRSAMR